MAAAVAVVIAFALFGGGGGEGTPQRPFVGGDLHSLVVDPAKPQRLYVGGHEGVAVSNDGGKSWRQIESLNGADAMGWAFAGERVLVGGHPGLYVSEDGGASFEQRNEGLPATDIHSLGAGRSLLYAASPQAGVFVSDDGGSSWQVRSEQAGRSFMGPILVDADDPDHVLASDMQNGVVESADGGRTWRALGGVQGAMWVTWDPGGTGRIIASGMGGAAQSSDGGRSWRPLEVPEGASVVEMSPHDASTLYAAVHEGANALVWVSADGGETWARPKS